LQRKYSQLIGDVEVPKLLFDKTLDVIKLNEQTKNTDYYYSISETMVKDTFFKIEELLRISRYIDNVIIKELKENPLVLTKNKIELYFDASIQEIVIQLLKEANEKVQIAVAWINDLEIITELNNCLERGCKVEIITSQSKDNEYLIDTEIGNYKSNYSIFIRGEIESKLMHNKYFIIDDEIAGTGSYNWTNGGSHTDENLVILYKEDVIQMFIEQFNQLKSKSKKYR